MGRELDESFNSFPLFLRIEILEKFLKYSKNIPVTFYAEDSCSSYVSEKFMSIQNTMCVCEHCVRHVLFVDHAK